MTDPDFLRLADASAPLFNHRADPVYAYRQRKHSPELNSETYDCLYPVLFSRLNRVISVVPQVIDLYEVFDDAFVHRDSQINYPL